MKIVQINSVCGSSSTGKICVAVSELLTAQNIENYILYAISNSDYPLGRKYMSPLEVKLQALKSRVFGNYGFQSKSATKRLIKELDAISPDIVQLHNLHSHNVNLEMLFSYFKKKKIKLFWTFHDCWAFTGYCSYYDIPECNKWKSECRDCPLKGHYSWFFDRSSYTYKKKKQAFSDLDMTIITPSKWLKEQVEQSFFSGYDIKVINNGIDLSKFYPQAGDFRKKYSIEDKYIVLGVAFDWGQRKGLDVFVQLSKRLDSRFQIVLVGTNDEIDKQLPKNIISIHRTQNQKELAEIYTAANVYANPTREEVFGLVNVESLACSTPVITFNTGGSPECIDEKSGIVVERNNVDALESAIRKVCIDTPFDKNDCINRAKLFDQKNKFREYVDLYMK